MPDLPTGNPDQFYQGAPRLRYSWCPMGRDFSILGPNGVLLVLGQDWD
jgi:hypothetical protein